MNNVNVSRLILTLASQHITYVCMYLKPIPSTAQFIVIIINKVLNTYLFFKIILILCTVYTDKRITSRGVSSSLAPRAKFFFRATVSILNINKITLLLLQNYDAQGHWPFCLLPLTDKMYQLLMRNITILTWIQKKEIKCYHVVC